MEQNPNPNPNQGLTKKDIITTIVIPLTVAIISVFAAGFFQLISISNANEAQMEVAKKAMEAQIKAAEISKVTEIKYDYKETKYWDVKESTDYMPLKKGNYWLYKGVYTAYSMNLKRVVTKDLKIKFEIVDELHNNGLSLFIISNFPETIQIPILEEIDQMQDDELLSSKPIQYTNGENVSGLFLVSNKLFHIPYEQLESVKKFINDPSKFDSQKLLVPTPALSYDNLIFEFPIYKGQRYGDLNNISRDDFSHFWYVNNFREIESLNGDTFEKIQVFELIYNTLPDQIRVTFRPYLGILFYNYKHNGSANEINLELTEYEIK